MTGKTKKLGAQEAQVLFEYQWALSKGARFYAAHIVKANPDLKGSFAIVRANLKKENKNV